MRAADKAGGGGKSFALWGFSRVPRRGAVPHPGMVLEADAHDAPVLARIDPAGLGALRAAFAFQPVGGGLAAILDSAAYGQGYGLCPHVLRGSLTSIQQKPFFSIPARH